VFSVLTKIIKLMKPQITLLLRHYHFC